MPKCCWTLVAAFVWLSAAGLSLSAAHLPHYSVKVWDTESGLPQNAVISMVQTHDGYLWLGTGNGLARFDGLHFTPFDASSAPGLDGKVVKLFEDSRRNLWIGTETSGVLLVDAAGHVSTVALGLPANEGPLRYICEDATGAVWLCMSRGQLYRFWDGKAFPVADNCRALDIEDHRLVWLATPTGRLIGLGPMMQAATPAIPVSYEIHLGRVDYILASPRGGYWRLAGGRIQKCKADRVEKEFSYPWSTDVPILAACEDREGNLIVGTFGDGAWWLDPQGKAGRIEGLSHPSIWSLMVDREGNLWVGTNGGGLDRVKRQQFEVLAGTEETAVQSVCAPSRGDGLWIGYNGERVDHWTGSNLERFTDLWRGAPTGPPTQARVYIHTVFEDSAGQVWAGGASGLQGWPCLFRLQDGQFAPVIPGPFHQDVSAMYQDPTGRFWLGTQNGLALWTNGEWKLFTTRDGLPSDYIRALAGDAIGNLWVGTAGAGVARLRDGKFALYRRAGQEGPPSDDVSSLYLDAAGVLWVGTAGGLGRYAEGKWTRYTTQEGLASNKIGYLFEDDAGVLWMGSNRGVMRVPKKSLTELAEGATPGPVACRIFGTSDGLPTGECSAGSQPGACRARDGQLWFPTIKGLVHVDPRQLVPNTNPPPVVIEAVKVDDQLQGTESLRAAGPAKVVVPADKESLEIFYTSLSFSAPELGRFRYRLTGHETTWTERAGTVRSARYIKLPRGDYVFEVKACNEDGVESATGATLAVTVLPAFWQTTWFIGLTSLAVLAILVGSVHYVSTQKLQRQVATLRQQEALEQERARIARDLHDQLGANLTQVALLGEMAESDKDAPAEVEGHARQISQTARETTRALDEIVWTVNPSNDTLDGLINYVCKYAQEYLALAGLRYRLEVPPQLPALPISPEVRHNLFLTAKEAVNNVVKHAHATCVWLRLKLEPSQFVLEIEDNGRGITAADEARGRNGLRNMRKRIEEVGGNFEIGAGADGGTRIRITVGMNALSGNRGNGKKEKVIRATVRQGGGDGGSR